MVKLFSNETFCFMKKLILFTFIILTYTTLSHAQEFENSMDKGRDSFEKGDYTAALELFISAYDIADTDSMENLADEWKTKSIKKIKQSLSEMEDLKKNTDEALRIALNEPNSSGKSGKNLYEVCKNKGLSNYNKKLYLDALQYFNLSKLCPDYKTDREIDSYISKSKTGLDSLKKIALVIGNANYAEVNLEKAIGDARDVAKALKSMNFEVTEGYNLKSSEFDLKVKLFFQVAPKYDIVFFFYTGYGYNSDFMLPVDTKIDDEGNVKKWFSLNFLMNEFPKNQTSKKIFVLDMDRSSKQGVTPTVLSFRNSMVVYSAAPNNPAFNGVGKNSLFTEQLLKYLTTPNIPFQEIFRLTREATMRISKDRQVPTIYDNIQNNIYLNWKID